MFRHSCGKCHFANTKRPSDITIADYWGWEKTDRDINKDDKGVSLILVNTEKGRELFEKVKDRMTVIPAKIENCMQPNLRHPSVIHPKRMLFEEEYTQNGFEYVINKYQDSMIKKYWRKIKHRIKKLIGSIF